MYGESVSIINTGCSGNTSKKEEKHTTETNNKGNKDTEEKTSEKSSEKTEKDTKKNVKYEYGITNLDSVEYVKDPVCSRSRRRWESDECANRYFRVLYEWNCRI